MTKAIMISINHEWVSKILNGEKTIEIRKTMPKCDFPIDVYVYCTKEREKNIVDRSVWFGYKDGKTLLGNCDTPYGKVVAKFTLKKVEEIRCCCVPYRKSNNLGYEYSIDDGVYKVDWKENVNLCDKESQYNNPENYKDEGVVFERNDRYIDTMFNNEDLKKMYLTPQKLLDYIHLGNKGYAWYIDDLVIFDKPKELSEYGLTKAPKNWCYVEENENDKEKL